MSDRVASRLAWTAAAAATALAALTACLILLGAGDSTPADASGIGGVGGMAESLAGLAFGVMGGLLASRVRANAIGWIFCAAGISLTLGLFAVQYADYGLFAASPRFPGGRLAVLLEDVVTPPTFGLVGVALLLFPDGTLPSRRWRPALWLCTLGIGAVMTGYLLRPGGGDEPFESVSNPLGVRGAFGLTDALSGLGWLGMGVGVALAALAMVRRLRRSHGLERQQLKWIALAAAVVGLIVVVDEVSYFAGLESVDTIRDALLGLGLATFPVAAGIAILRHRLYDIDVVINRALVYGALTAALAGTYLASVLLLQVVLPERSSLATAVSTLAVAALFRPARARIQATVDKRFFRRRYDAAQTLAAFGARMRDEMALEAMSAQLHDVVRETMQPAGVTLWLAERRS